MSAAFDRRTQIRLLELAVVLGLSHYFAHAIQAVAVAAGMPLPTTPMLGHTYLFFSFVMLLCVWLRFRDEPLSEFGLVVPKHWLRYLWQGAAIFLVAMTFDVVVRPFLDAFVSSITGTSKTLAEQHFAALHGNRGMLVYLVLVGGWLYGGLGEEIFYRGYVMRRAAQILGDGRAAWIAALVFQAALFGLAHYNYQGPVGAVAIFFGAMIVGTGYLLCGRVLWPVVIAHGLQDTVGFIALYTGVAHA